MRRRIGDDYVACIISVLRRGMQIAAYNSKGTTMARPLTAATAKETASHRKTFGGGRKRKAEEDEIKAALEAAAPLVEVLKALAEKAKAGEGWAVNLYTGYYWGKPVERQEITGADGGAIQYAGLTDAQLEREIIAARKGVSG